MRHRLGISWADTRYFAKHHRWVALVRSLWLTQVLRNYGERCQVCGRPMRLLWWSPTPLWAELISNLGGGCLCPRCYNDECERAGIRVIWTPMVAGRYENGKLTPTTNWWLSDTRDWLMMGVPDPECFDRDRSDDVYPTQWPWKRIKDEMQDVIPPPDTASFAKQEAPPSSRVAP